MTDRDGHDIDISKGQTKEIMKQATGARVSDDAALQVASQLEEQAHNIATASWIIAQNAGRKTIQEKDVRDAIRINDTL